MDVVLEELDELEDDPLEEELEDDEDPETGISNALSIPFAISSIRELKILLSVAESEANVSS